MDNSTSVIYKAGILEKVIDAADDDRPLKNAKILLPLRYLSNFIGSLEMSLVNCQIYLELNWREDCVMFGAETYDGSDNASNREPTFKITSSKLCVPIFTLSTNSLYNVHLKKGLNEEFNGSVFLEWIQSKNRIKKCRR